MRNWFGVQGLRIGVQGIQLRVFKMLTWSVGLGSGAYGSGLRIQDWADLNALSLSYVANYFFFFVDLITGLR